MAIHDTIVGITKPPLHCSKLAGLQASFFSVVGLPLYKAMADAFEETMPLYEGAMANFKVWEALGARGAS